MRENLVIRPSELQIQWQDQMRDKSGLEFHIDNSEEMKRLRREREIHVIPWIDNPRLITSMDYLKGERTATLQRATSRRGNRPHAFAGDKSPSAKLMIRADPRSHRN